jgi:hypothetical protein
VFGNLDPKSIWYTLGEGCPETTTRAKVPRGELGVEGTLGKVHHGNVDKDTDLEGGLAMHWGSVALGTVGSINRVDGFGLAVALGAVGNGEFLADPLEVSSCQMRSLSIRGSWSKMMTWGLPWVQRGRGGSRFPAA